MDTDITDADVEQIDREKSLLRLRARAARRAVLPEQRHAYAYALAERVLRLPEMAGAMAVLLYGAAPEEADPSVLEFALRELGVRIAYPRVAGVRMLALHWVDSPDVLVSGAFGLLEPLSDTPSARLDRLSAMIVPGVAFDADGNRLGFGGGYYDGLLDTDGPRPPAIGFAYDEQIVERVPVAAPDQPVDVIVTPTRTLRRSTRTP